jgi:hypothetical protein
VDASFGCGGLLKVIVPYPGTGRRSCGLDRRQFPTWAAFIKSHWDVLAAIDFTIVEVWTTKGLVTLYLLMVMEIKTRRVHFAWLTTNPGERWMKQVARNLTDAEGFLQGKRYILMDWDGAFCDSFRRTLREAGVKPVRLPQQSPNLNAHLERFWRSLKDECLDRMIFFGENMLRRAVQEFLARYHTERNHQGLDNQLIEPGNEVARITGKVECRERLGGLLKYYYRDAVWPSLPNNSSARPRPSCALASIPRPSFPNFAVSATTVPASSAEIPSPRQRFPAASSRSGFSAEFFRHTRSECRVAHRSASSSRGPKSSWYSPARTRPRR